MIPAKIRRPLAFLWRWALVAATIQLLVALEIAAVGYLPGLPRDQQIVYRVLLELGAGILVAFCRVDYQRVRVRYRSPDQLNSDTVHSMYRTLI